MVTATAMIQRGNEKLGRSVWTVSTLAGPTDVTGGTCPGASTYCEAVCYAKRIQARRPNVRASWGSNTDLLRADPRAYQDLLRQDLLKLRAGSVVRIHVSGDFESQSHVDLWRELAAEYPALTFYAYTRSWVIGLDFSGLQALENVRIWWSHDATMTAPPVGNVASIFESTEDAAAAGFTVCPEQTGKRASCSDCGLCWKVADATGTEKSFHLAFLKH